MTVRLGLVAASSISETAVIEPAALVDGVELTAVGARDVARAQAMAARLGMQHAFGSYRELVTCPDVDAVYVGTPASMHREWAVAAIEAGKHVLCEKPFAANAADARLIADAARASDVVVMEAFHWRYHPYAAQILAVLDSGVLGQIERIETVFDIPDGHIARDDIRWNYSVGGGATMDLGCYSIQWARLAGGPDPVVVSASAVSTEPNVDDSLLAELRWPSGVTGSIHSSMVADGDSVVATLKVIGSKGTMFANNPLAPQNFEANGAAVITVDAEGSQQRIEADRSTTYYHQLVAFRDAIVDGKPFPTTADDGVKMMEIIDACYEAAGLPLRPTA
jgi:predicted dehydrogenase